MTKYLFWCAFEQLAFRIPEFESISKVLGIQLKWIEKNDELPWVIIELNSDDEAKKLLSRSLSTKHCIQLWGEGKSYNEFHSNMRNFPYSQHAQLLSAERSFKVNVESFQRKTSRDEKIQRIESMAEYFPAKGDINLKTPDVEYSFLEFWGLDQNNLPPQPTSIFFGLSLGEGQRHLMTKHSIKTRKFIGNTTMDPQLALLMANLGLVDNGSFVLDPFVGTGSLLLAAAQFRGVVFGGDIDFLTLHARSRPSRKGDKVRAVDESMSANFEQYGLTDRYGDVIACDFSRSPWREDLNFDLIVTDPPYGIREQMVKVGTEKDFTNKPIPEQYLDVHIPEKISYSLEQILEDLLNFSATRLTIGGRLVYWIPVIRQQYEAELLPSHPALSILYNCEQVLTSNASRRLIVMEKKSNVTGQAIVHSKITQFKDQYYAPLAGNISKKERKQRIKKFGHLNISEAEMVDWSVSRSERQPYWKEREQNL